ncbi:MAG TPA: DUF3592 domain-containing protein [Candidatus Acidoferrales bacterium]|nr:DUF3592 domain-containing protein [Candidatus Acidoferrales bacterium]
MKIAAHWHELALIFALIAVIAALSWSWLFGRETDTKEVERERRSYLNRVGRIVDGQVVEIVERAAEQENAKRTHAAKLKAINKTMTHRMLLYSYSISGVTYEAAQDITGLEEQACLERVVAGQPVGVKYDPANPSNSILIADDWSGLS